MKFEMATSFRTGVSFIHSAIVRVLNNTRVTIQCRLIKRLHSNPPLLKLSHPQQNQNQRKRYVGHIKANFVFINSFWKPVEPVHISKNIEGTMKSKE